MVLSFLKKHKKFLKSTKNSTERRKVFNIYPHSVHIRKFRTETLVKSTFVHYPSVVLSDLENGLRRKKNRNSRRFLLFPFLAFGFLLQNFVFSATTSTIFRSYTNFNDVFLRVLIIYSSGGACFYIFLRKNSAFSCDFRKNSQYSKLF